MKKKRRLIKSLILTTLFGGLQVGILFLSDFISRKLSLGNKDILFISLAIVLFFVLSYFSELIDDSIN